MGRPMLWAAVAVVGMGVVLWAMLARPSDAEKGGAGEDAQPGGGHHSTQTDPVVRELQETMRVLARELAGLRREVRSLKGPRGEGVGSTVEPDVTASAGSGEGEAEKDNAVARVEGGGKEGGGRLPPRERAFWESLTPREADAYMLGVYDEYFASETRDARWADSAETTIREVAGRPEAGAPSVRRTECRSTLCRTELEFGTVSAREQFFLWAPLAEPWGKGPGFVRSEGWGDTQVEVYFARPGHDLPTVSPPEDWSPDGADDG